MGAGAVRVGIVGDFDAAFFAHAATDAALARAVSAGGSRLAGEWVPTEALAEPSAAAGRLAGYDGLWLAPGSPYRSFEGAVNAVRFARERGVPLLAT